MKTYTIDEMKRAFECGRNFQLTGENNFQELIEELNQALRQPPVISCVCPNEIKTGTVAIHCCNLCGKPDEDWWGKH